MMTTNLLRAAMVAAMTLAAFAITACGSDDDELTSSSTTVADTDSIDTNAADSAFATAVTVAFSSSGATVNNPFESLGVAVSVSGNDVIITSTNTDSVINYVLTGTASEGMFKLYSEKKFGLVLNGVDIHNSDGPAINIQSGKTATVNVVDGTNNRLLDGSTYASSTEDQKGTLFTEGKLNFTGTGTLIIKGYYKHAIVADEGITVSDGNITIAEATKDGIHANDYFAMTGGTLSITCTGDAVEVEEGYITLAGGTIGVTSADGDGFKTSYDGTDSSIDVGITVSGGKITLDTSGEKGHGFNSAGTLTVKDDAVLDLKVAGNGSKALKGDGNIVVSGGTLTLATSGSAFYDTDDADISSPSGIKADGNFTMTGGTIGITSTGAGGKGISADGYIVIDDGTLTVKTSGARFVYGSDDTAAKAVKADGNLTINGGTITINTTGQEAEGLESKATLTINGGEIYINAYDDAINASTSIVLNGGKIYAYSVVNDAIDSNGTLTITGGTVIAAGATSPEAGFDCDNSTFKVTGGTIIGFGGDNNTPTTSVSTQRSVKYSGSGTQGQLFRVQSSTGADVITATIPRTYSQMSVLFSSSAITSGASYTIYTGGSISGGTSWNGYYTGGTYTAGTSVATFTSGSMVTTVGSSSTIGGGGRR